MSEMHFEMSVFLEDIQYLPTPQKKAYNFYYSHCVGEDGGTNINTRKLFPFLSDACFLL